MKNFEIKGLSCSLINQEVIKNRELFSQQQMNIERMEDVGATQLDWAKRKLRARNSNQKKKQLSLKIKTQKRK